MLRRWAEIFFMFKHIYIFIKFGFFLPQSADEKQARKEGKYGLY